MSHRVARITALTGAIAAMASFAELAEGATPTGMLFRTIKVSSREYRYAIYVPRDYSRSKEWPVIVFLHGMGECGIEGSRQLAVGLGPALLLAPDRWPFLVVFPQKPSPRDRWDAHEGAIMAMLTRLRRDYRVDRDRVYLTGISQGGNGTWVIGSRRPEIWAAIAPICGYGDPAAIGPGLTNVPVWAFHGEADPVVPASQTRDIAASVEQNGGSVKVTIFPGVDHNSWDRAYRDERLYEWLLQHRLPERRRPAR
ncbi:MAG TPA: prolyl oligopeptidase family serine peptidase [Chthonomonadales bacterium]|nr:prolyl oligopeptidase family serine peptidase [Chthonomonadales bacterium]